MQKKILFISNTALFSRFNLPFMRWFREQGWQVDYVSAGENEIPDCDNQYAIPIQRSPYSLKNIAAYKALKKILLQNDYDIIHCHSPMGGVLGRLAAKNTKIRAKVLYTAHGFHFYKGASLFNWLLYYPIEVFFAKYTDALITINEEDYCNAKKRLSSCKNIYKIDGVGVDLSKFYPRTLEEKAQLRSRLGYSENDFIVTNVAEINKNKNQLLLVRSLQTLKKRIPNLKVLFIGEDYFLKTKPKLEQLINQNQLQNTAHFLGYRQDVDELTAISDIAFSASLREGLPVNIIEAMACGVPIVCKKNRGHHSLIENGKSGLLFTSSDEMIDGILKIHESKAFADTLSKKAIEDSKRYDREIIIKEMAKIYDLCK